MFVQRILYCVQCSSFPPVAEICARLAGNFCQYMSTVSCWANSLVWVSVCYFRASQQGGGWRGSEATLSPQRYTAFHYLAQVARAGRGVVFPPLGTIQYSAPPQTMTCVTLLFAEELSNTGRSRHRESKYTGTVYSRVAEGGLQNVFWISTRQMYKSHRKEQHRPKYYYQLCTVYACATLLFVAFT